MKKKKNKINFKVKAKIYITKILDIIKMPEMANLPGQMAFSMLLALVPTITLSCYISNLFGFDYNIIIDLVNSIIPGGASYLMPPIDNGGVTFLFTILVIWLFYLSSSGCNSIILISNQIYGIKQTTWGKRRIKAIFMSLAVVLMLMILLVFQILSNRLEGLLSPFNYGNIIYFLFKILRIPIMFIFLLFFLRAFYNFAPDRVRNSNRISFGTIFTSVGWTIVTLVYSYIAEHMSNYIILYGGLANLALLMVWTYFLSYIFVIGLALNHSDEEDED